MLDIYKERFANNINIFFLLILTSIPSMLIELKYGFDIFYNERIRAITSLFSVLSVPAYALFWTVFISYFHKYIKIIF